MGDEHVGLSGPRSGSALVVDPYPVSLDAVASLLRRSGIVADTHQATSWMAALTTVRRRGIGLVVLDAHLDRPRSGLHLCRQLKRLADPPTVLVFTGANNPSVVTTCVANGADAFVHRSATPEQFVDAVQSTVAGRPVWFLGEPNPERGPAKPVTDPPPEAPYDGSPDSSAELVSEARFAELTGREQEVFTLLLRRYSNEEIAAELRLARQTVKNLVSSVLQKTGAANRRELLQLARSRDRRARHHPPAAERAVDG